MKRSSLKLVFLILLVSVSSYYSVSPGTSHAQEFGLNPRIHVYVTDHDGFPLDEVLIQVVTDTVVDSGTTVRGNWTSGPLDSNSTYLVIASSTDETAAEEVYLGETDIFVSFKLNRFIDEPKLVLTNVTFTSPKIFVGGIYEAILEVQNLGEGNATDVSLIVNMSYPFAIMTSGSRLDLGTIEANASATATLIFAVDGNARPGAYSVPYVLRFADATKKELSTAGKLGIVVYGVPVVKVGQISFEPLTMSPGDSGTLTITLTNTGTDRALDVTVELSGVEEVFSATYGRLGAIDPRGSQDIRFGLKVPTDFPLGNYTINLSVSYVDTSGNVYTSEQPFMLRVFPRGAPTVRVGSLKLDPLTMMAGDSGTLTITLTNTGTDRALDVGVVLGGMTEVFSYTYAPVGVIEAGETVSTQFGMELRADLDPDTYTIDIFVSYSDIFGKNYSLKESYHFTVFPPLGSPLVKITGIEQNPLDILPASDGEIIVTLSNLGQTRAYDVTITLSGFIPGLSNPFRYLGGMEVNEVSTIKFGLKLDEKVAPGPYSLDVILSYKDGMGNSYTDIQPFSFTIFPLAKPDVKVGEISVEPIMLRPGYSASFLISLENVGMGDARNIVLKISGWDEGLSSTVGYIGGLEPGESSKISFGVDVPLTMSQGLVLLKVSWSYESIDGERFSDEVPYDLRIFPLGTPEVKIQKISSDPLRLTQGVNGSLIILLTNAGDGRARDVNVDVTRGPEVLSSTSGYAGRLDVGQNMNVTFVIRIPRDMPAADYQAEISISYKDASGKTYGENRSFALSIFEAGRPEIRVQNVLYNPVKLAQGVSGFATIFLTNTGDAQAKSITLKISGGTEVLANAILNVGAIDPGKTETVIVGVSIPQATKPGTYLLKVTMVYEDFFRKIYEDTGFLEVNVSPSETLFTSTNLAIMGVIVVLASVGFLAWRRLR